MKTLIVSTLALTFNVGAFINTELAFALMVGAGVLAIVVRDYASPRTAASHGA